jgi:hypothetical protein
MFFQFQKQLATSACHNGASVRSLMAAGCRLAE